MKSINLYLFSVAYSNLQTDQCTSLFNKWGVDPKPDEKESIKILVEELSSLCPYDNVPVIRILDGCYFGFQIPRISKEFDCLWISDKSVVNIELKSKPISNEEIKKQHERNQYYLRFLGKTLHSFTFESQNKKCYRYTKEGRLENVSIKDIGETLCDIHKEDLFLGDVSTCFKVEDYLVSPFNSTDAFLRREYFLNSQQEEIKRKIINIVENEPGGTFCAITGGPGSGKTLLLYDIVRTIQERGRSIIIGQAGGLNIGHENLKKNGWNILQTNRFVCPPFGGSPSYINQKADVYFIDEAQRCRDLKIIYNEVRRLGKHCVFSFDSDQFMSNGEKKYDNGNKILSYTGNDRCFRLTTTIRTNQSVYEFIRALFNLRASVNCSNANHVELSYCENETDLQATLKYLKDKGFLVPKYTPGQYSRFEYENWILTDEPSAHEVIGQEYDNVAGVVTPNLEYNTENNLVTTKDSDSLYLEDRMLYQILTRARNKIHIVVYKNQHVLERCISIIRP